MNKKFSIMIFFIIHSRPGLTRPGIDIGDELYMLVVIALPKLACPN
jgi:hypothetical protein